MASDGQVEKWLFTPEQYLPSAAAEAFLEQLRTTPAAWVHVLSSVLLRPTPPEIVQKREGPQKLILAYVDGAYAIVTLAGLAQLGISSDFEVLQTDASAESVECLGKLTFSFWCNGSWHSTSKSQWGDCERRGGMTLGSAKKGAATDALKKCLSQFGWAMDVYTTTPEYVEPPSREEMATQSLATLFTIGKNQGMTEDEVRKYVWDEVGQEPEALSVKDLSAVKRRLQRSGRRAPVEAPEAADANN